MVFSTRIGIVNKIGFVVSLVMVTAIALLYFYNMERWAKLPELGFAFRSATGTYVIGVVTEAGHKAGMKIGDCIVKMNGTTPKNIKEFRKARNYDIGGQNHYHLERKGSLIEVFVENRPLGFAKVFMRCGFNYLTGLCYIVVGVLVFLMKPYYKASTIFYLFCITFGSLIFFLYRSGEIKPYWFNTVHIFLYTFSPALFIHLALAFPERRMIIVSYPRLQIVPYILSALLFIGIRSNTGEMTGIPKFWYLLLMAYFVPSILFYLLSCLYSWVSSRSAVAISRAKLILLGSALTASLPLLDTVANALFNFYLVPKFSYYIPFLIIFPIVIAYTIVKHNLFDIDAAIRRTFGYILATLGIALLYTLFVYVPSMFFGHFQLSKSPVYMVLVTVIILFFFSAIRSRIQKIIDRIYYRIEYDYQDAIHNVSNQMRSLMRLDDIGKHMIDTINNTMFVDSGCVMLLDTNSSSYKCLVSSGDIDNNSKKVEKKQLPGLRGFGYDPTFEQLKSHGGLLPATLADIEIPADEPFLKKIQEKKDLVTYDDIHENPFFQDERDSVQAFFRMVNASLIVPMVYEDQLIGLMSLGQKKSGKFYCQEDISLLMTLANQGAVAIENARMVDKIVEKDRLQTQILDTFGKYVSHEVRDQILDGNIPLDGELKEVTVLFADLRDFTTLAEATPPKEIVTIINDYFSEMSDSIHQHRGLVLQFIGDEIEAVFGAPLPLEDHPTFAVKAALEMRERLNLVNTKLKKRKYEPLQHGIGIHTGSVVAANIGSRDRMSYAMVGDTVNVASRIQGLNKETGSDILISETTRALLSDDIKTIKLPAMKVKGKRNPVEVYQVQ